MFDNSSGYNLGLLAGWSYSRILMKEYREKNVRQQASLPLHNGSVKGKFASFIAFGDT